MGRGPRAWFNGRRRRSTADEGALLLGAGQIGAAAISPVDAQSVILTAHAQGERLDHAGGRLARAVGPIALLGDLVQALLQLLDLQIESIQPLAFAAGLALATAHEAQAQQAASQQQRLARLAAAQPVAAGARVEPEGGAGDGHGGGGELFPS